MKCIQRPRLSSPKKRRELAPESEAAFQAFSQVVFADGALSSKTKQPCDTVALLHSGAHEGHDAVRSDRARADGMMHDECMVGMGGTAPLVASGPRRTGHRATSRDGL